jgi:hypothetical protein
MNGTTPIERRVYRVDGPGGQPPLTYGAFERNALEREVSAYLAFWTLADAVPFADEDRRERELDELIATLNATAEVSDAVA